MGYDQLNTICKELRDIQENKLFQAHACGAGEREREMFFPVCSSFSS